MKLIPIVLVLLMATAVTAQTNIDSMRRAYTTKTMRIGNGVFVDGYRISQSTTRQLMTISPEATLYYQRYKKNNQMGVILPLIGLATSITGLIIENKNRSTGLTVIISGSVISAVGSIFKGLHISICKMLFGPITGIFYIQCDKIFTII
ncbi:MAG: hypothetical protein IPP69_13455 [Flavobacteriales bacterium]|nr:hypothetical protein [Flavobacteriales bacterium]